MMKETKFKQTEVGMIPSDWMVEPLEMLLTRIANGMGYDARNLRGYPMSRIETISKGKINFEKVGFSKEKPKEIFKLEYGDILYSHINSMDYIGNVAYYDSNIPLYHGMNLLLLRTKIKKIESLFLFYYLCSKRARITAQTLAKPAVNQASISVSELSKIEIPLPPTIEEQQRISNALSDVDTLIANLEKLIAKKKNIKQGAMQQLLTGRKRLSGFGSDERTGSRPTDERRKECRSERSAKREVEESSGYKMTELGLIPNDWEVKKLKTECTLITKGTTPSSLGFSFVSSGINFLKIEAIDKFGNLVKENLVYIDELTNRALYRSQLQKNDLLISIAGALGRMFIVKDTVLPANINQALAIIRLKKDSLFDYKYVFYFLSSTQSQNIIKDLTVTGAQPNISLDNVRNFWIASPSSKAEQTAIANVLSDMDTEISALETKLAKYRTLKTGMMQELLTGTVRLVCKRDKEE